jgi:hypothetical protein
VALLSIFRYAGLASENDFHNDTKPRCCKEPLFNIRNVTFIEIFDGRVASGWPQTMATRNVVTNASTFVRR